MYYTTLILAVTTTIQIAVCGNKGWGNCDKSSCKTCASSSVWYGATCRWCPRGSGSCHQPGAILANPCSSYENIKDVANCPNHQKDFNPNEGFRAFKFAKAAYSNCLENCNAAEFQNYQIIKTIKFNCWDNKLRCFVYVTASSTDRLVIISYRGTDGGISQLVDEFLGTLLKFKESCPVGGKVYEYFNEGVMNTKSVLRYTIQPYLDKGYNLWITGHSLGGAFATILSGYASVEKWLDQSNLYLYTFGSPRVGNYDFAQGHAIFVPNSYRVVHRKDIVSHLPICSIPLHIKTQNTTVSNPKSSPFIPCPGSSSMLTLGPLYPYHVGVEIFYDNDMSNINNYRVCKISEDESCSNKHTPIVIGGTSDHDKDSYYNHKNNICSCNVILQSNKNEFILKPYNANLNHLRSPNSSSNGICFRFPEFTHITTTNRGFIDYPFSTTITVLASSIIIAKEIN